MYNVGRLLKTLRTSELQENEDDHCSDFCLKRYLRILIYVWRAVLVSVFLLLFFVVVGLNKQIAYVMLLVFVQSHWTMMLSGTFSCVWGLLLSWLGI